MNTEDVAQIEVKNDNPLPNARIVDIPLNDIISSDDDEDDVDLVFIEAQAI